MRSKGNRPSYRLITVCFALRRRQEVTDVYNTPLMDLVYSAATVHRMYNDPTMVRKIDHPTSHHRSCSHIQHANTAAASGPCRAQAFKPYLDLMLGVMRYVVSDEQGSLATPFPCTT